MQKLATLFTDSYQELKQVRTITTAAMFGAISVVLGCFTLVLGESIKLGFSTISSQFVYYLFGPVVGAFFGGAIDILVFMVRPTGPYFPGFTITPMVAGILYGCMYYKRQLTFRRVLVAELVVSLICNLYLNTLWLSILQGKGFWFLMAGRSLKIFVMWPVNALLFYSIWKGLEAAGVFRELKKSIKV